MKALALQRRRRSWPALAAVVRHSARVSVLVVAASRPEARGAVVVGAVEVGNQGGLTPGFPAAVRAEVTTDARLDGTFRAWLARSAGVRADDGSFSPEGHSTSLRLLLEPGEKRRVTVFLADLPRDCLGLDVRWSVSDLAGQRLAEGAQPFRCASQRVLYLSDTAVPFARRSPSAAFTEVQSYFSYEACLISGRDFGELRAEQREALLDRTSLGGALVLSAPLAPAGDELERDLAAPDALVWRDAAGREFRETRLHLGVVRTVDRPLPELARAAETPLGSLLLADGPVLPAAEESGFRRRPFAGLVGLSNWAYPLPAAGTVRLGRLVTTAGFALLGSVLIGLWWTSRPQVATPALAVWVGAAGLSLSPVVAYYATASARAGNRDECWALVIHDRPGRTQSRWSLAILGGGGGREDPVLASTIGPGSIWSAVRPGETEGSLRVEQDPDGRLRVGLGRRGPTIDRVVGLRRADLGPDDPAWDAADLAIREGRALGTLRARRPLARVAIVARPGIALFGAVRPGERLDVSGARWSALPPRWEKEPADPIERVASDLWNIGLGRRRPALSYVVGSEASACGVSASAGGEAPTSFVVHVEPLTMDPAAELASPLSAVREADRLHVRQPEALGQRMRSRGLSFEPEVPFLDASRGPDVSAEVVDGFREMVFRVGGAAPTGGVHSAAGAGLVVGRWRTVSPRHP